VGLPIKEADFTISNFLSFIKVWQSSTELKCLVWQARKTGVPEVIEQETNHSDTHSKEKSDSGTVKQQKADARDGTACEGCINLEG